MATEAYKEHRPGSPKGVVHKVFDEKGKEAAIRKASQLGLQESTARTWCSSWGKGSASKKATATKDSAAKGKGKKASAKPKASAAPAAKPSAKKKKAKKPAAESAPIKRETLSKDPE